MARDFSPPATTSAAAGITPALAQSSNPSPEPSKPDAMKPAADAAAAAGPSGSPLDKPLPMLTEEDIAQLTREDCRRFLKAKGMRRPSWNKSQAIQQVISLKALLEGRPGSGDSPIGPGILCKPSPAPAPSDAVRSSGKEAANGESQPPAPAKEPSPYRRRDPIPPLFFAGDSACLAPSAGRYHRQVPAENCCFSPRVTAEVPTEGQMTIFYDGKVNVYDGVTTEQARLIMETAASPVCYDALPRSGPFLSVRPPVPVFSEPVMVAPVTASPVAGVLTKTSVTGRSAYRVADVAEDWRVPRINEPECFTSRKASVQRYLEKKKDRFKGKQIISGSAPANMEVMYLAQKFRCYNTGEQSGTIDRSPTLPQPPGTPTRSNSTDIRPQTEKISIDLNEGAEI